MAETQQPQSIADRIAALKLNQVGQPPPGNESPVNGTSSRRPPPPPPPRPTLPERPGIHGRTLSSNNPPLQEYAPVSNGGIGNLPEGGQLNNSIHVSKPALPARTPTQSSLGPSLPPRQLADPPAHERRPSNHSLSRQDSNESSSSVATSQSGRMRAPVYDPSALPALPPKRTDEEKAAAYRKHSDSSSRRPFKSTKSSPNVPQRPIESTPTVPLRPTSRMPSLPSRADSTEVAQTSPVPSPPPRQLETVPPPPRRSALSMGFGKPNGQPSTNVSEHASQVDGNDQPLQMPRDRQPPPVPMGSRPDLAALQVSKPRVNGPAATPAPTTAGSWSSCLLCRDYSAPDNHAARFPRQSLPSSDIGWLAQQLTAPFPSLTDKARAIFTWLHHNVAYDTVSFFNNNVRASTPQSTLQTGLAVCEGYAGLFAALAMKAGLEAQVLSGHGKGYGYAALNPGDPIPPYSAGHAWNAVKIDGGQWKLIDGCWGAGVVNGKGKPYEKRFAPERFVQSNDEFGLDHFPGDNTKQFRSDGRIITWPEYINGYKDGCGADFFSGYVAEEGLDKTTFKPTHKQIKLSQQPGPTMRFSFQKVCPHWDPVRCGKGPQFLYVLHLGALDGTQRNHIPFETNGDVWWCDVAVQDLGGPGMKAMIYAVTEFDGGNGRGVTIQRYRERKGRCAMQFAFVCAWQIA